MRISDWSSDVCSSDLPIEGIAYWCDADADLVREPRCFDPNASRPGAGHQPMLGCGIGRLMHMGGTHCSARRRPELIGKHRLLNGEPSLARTDMDGNIDVQPDIRELPLIMTEVGAVRCRSQQGRER